MPEPLNSMMIGVIEITLALLVWHRALPAMMRLAAEADPLPPQGIIATVRRLIAGPLRPLETMGAVAAFAWRAVTRRLMVLKLWALGFALGTFGIGRAFGPAYVASDAWLFTIGHWCLITYATLRLAHIARNSTDTWWRQL